MSKFDQAAALKRHTDRLAATMADRQDEVTAWENRTLSEMHKTERRQLAPVNQELSETKFWQRRRRAELEASAKAIRATAWKDRGRIQDEAAQKKAAIEREVKQNRIEVARLQREAEQEQARDSIDRSVGRNASLEMNARPDQETGHKQQPKARQVQAEVGKSPAIPEPPQPTQAQQRAARMQQRVEQRQQQTRTRTKNQGLPGPCGM